MLIPNRHENSPAYRYGFNGMEKDDEIKGDAGKSYDFGARMLDPRVGRWFAPDKMEAKYPEESTFIFCGNNPIIFFDPDGNDRIYSRAGKLIEDTGEGNLIQVKFGKNNYKLLSELDYSKKGTRKSVSNIIALEAGAIGYKGYFGVKEFQGDVSKANVVTMPYLLRTVFINSFALANGTMDNMYDLRSTLFHEADTNFGHRSESYEKEYTFLQHALVYYNQSKAKDFDKTSKDKKINVAGAFVERIFTAFNQGEIGNGEDERLVNDFNKHHNGKIIIDYKSDLGSARYSITVGNTTTKETEIKLVEKPEN